MLGRSPRRSGADGAAQDRAGRALNPIAEEIGLIVVLASCQMRVAIGDGDGDGDGDQDARNLIFFLSREAS